MQTQHFLLYWFKLKAFKWLNNGTFIVKNLQEMASHGSTWLPPKQWKNAISSADEHIKKSVMSQHWIRLKVEKTLWNRVFRALWRQCFLLTGITSSYIYLIILTLWSCLIWTSDIVTLYITHNSIDPCIPVTADSNDFMSFFNDKITDLLKTEITKNC